jgi:hypothetical protein
MSKDVESLELSARSPRDPFKTNVYELTLTNEEVSAVHNLSLRTAELVRDAQCAADTAKKKADAARESADRLADVVRDILHKAKKV